MKLTSKQLRKIIKEELKNVLSETKMIGGMNWEMGIDSSPVTNDTSGDHAEKPITGSSARHTQQLAQLEKLAADQHMDWALDDASGMDDVLDVKKQFQNGKATIKDLINVLSNYGYNHQ